MKYVYPIIGIIGSFAWCIFLLNQQRHEIILLKAQLSISNDYVKDLENDVNSCKGDVDFLKNGVEDMIKVCVPR